MKVTNIWIVLEETPYKDRGWGIDSLFTTEEEALKRAEEANKEAGKTNYFYVEKADEYIASFYE